jgi:hypothetical protein
MTDDYEPVTASDLKDGDEGEIVFKFRVADDGPLTEIYVMPGYYPIASVGSKVVSCAHTIRRKVRPIGAGDRVKHLNGANAEVRCIDGNDAWVVYDGSGTRATWALSDLTRVTP